MIDAHLVDAVRALNNAAPREFDNFLRAFKTYADTQTTNLIKSPALELPRAQGRAQNCTEILDLLANHNRMAVQRERLKNGNP